MKLVKNFSEVLVYSIISMVLTIVVMSYNESYIDYSGFIVDAHLPLAIFFFFLFINMGFYTKMLCEKNNAIKRSFIILLSANSILSVELLILALFSTLDVNTKFILTGCFLACFIGMFFLQYVVNNLDD